MINYEDGCILIKLPDITNTPEYTPFAHTCDAHGYPDLMFKGLMWKTVTCAGSR